MSAAYTLEDNKFFNVIACAMEAGVFTGAAFGFRFFAEPSVGAAAVSCIFLLNVSPAIFFLRSSIWRFASACSA